MSGQELIKCYHVSKIKNRESILRRGLIPKKGTIWGSRRLFFSTSKKNIGFDYVDYINVDVWVFYLPKNKIRVDENAWKTCFKYTTEVIQAKDLKLEETVIV